MVKKTVSTYQNPLDWFLDTDRDDYDNLTVLARRFRAEPFDADSFRSELVAKLQRLKYQRVTNQRRKLPADERTFYEILTDAGVLETLLQPSTLGDLWKCLLLKRIANRDRELEHEKKAVDGNELRFHSGQARQIWRDLGAIEEIVERHNARDEAEKLYEKLNSQLRKHMRILLISTKYRVPRTVLLSGRPLKERRHNPKDENVATKVAIYRTLKEKLQTKATRKKGVFDIFLCQLAELVWAPRDVQKLTTGQTLYTDQRRLP
jgi:hypothetical protein